MVGDASRLARELATALTGRRRCSERGCHVRSADSFAYSEFLDRLTPGSSWGFRLTANPVHYIRRPQDPKDTPTKRAAHVTPRHQIGWLLQRQERAGFEVLRSPAERRLTEHGHEHEVIVHTRMPRQFGKRDTQAASHQVVLYATNTARAKQLIKAAKQVHPTIDAAVIKISHAKYTKKVLDTAIAEIIKGSAVRRAADLTVYSAAPAPDGSGILVSAKKSSITRTHAMLAGQTTIPVKMSPGAPVTAATWRWNDAAAFIGGDVIISDARKSGYWAQCTSGLTAYDSSGEEYLITADHCFPKGANVTGEGDAVGSFDGTAGNHIGYVEGSANGAIPAETSRFDAELVDAGSGNGWVSSDEADSPSGKWYPVTSSAYSYNGQAVCQDGARSYYDGHGVPCGIKVTNQDVTYNLAWDDGSVHSVRGVEGVASSGWALEQGDSGGLVFSVASSTARQARGLVSASNSDTDHSTMYWTEAPDILSTLGVSMQNVT